MADPSPEDVRPEDVRPEDVRDVLPADLDATAFVGPYKFPDIARRRIPGALYLAAGLVMVLAWAIARPGGAVMANGGLAVGGAVLVLIGLYHVFVAGWRVKVGETAALAAAAKAIGFPVGHASAQLGWQGVTSKPTWRILLYSSENPPLRRGLVLVDAIDAAVLGQLVQDNPEDWSGFDR